MVVYVDTQLGRQDGKDAGACHRFYKQIWEELKPGPNFMSKDSFQPQKIRVNVNGKFVSKKYTEWTMEELKTLLAKHKTAGSQDKSTENQQQTAGDTA